MFRLGLLALCTSSCTLLFDASTTVNTDAAVAGIDGGITAVDSGQGLADGNMGDGGTSSSCPSGDPGASGCTSDFMYRVFITSSLNSGNLGGLDGADSRCMTKATEAALSGNFVAYVSTLTQPAWQRLNGGGPWYLTTSELVACDASELADGCLGTPINKDESGELVDNKLVWTGAHSTIADRNCSNWTSAAVSSTAFVGNSSQSSDAFMTAQTATCQLAMRLYCFEVPEVVQPATAL